VYHGMSNKYAPRQVAVVVDNGGRGQFLIESQRIEQRAQFKGQQVLWHRQRMGALSVNPARNLYDCLRRQPGNQVPVGNAYDLRSRMIVDESIEYRYYDGAVPDGSSFRYCC